MIKRKRILRLFVAAGLVVVVLAVLAIAIFRSAPFHRYVLAKMIQKASDATGGKVEIGDFRFHLSGLRVDVDHIVLHGSESAPHPPLLEIDHLLVGLKILSLWSREINLSEIVVDHPSIHFSVDAKGNTNLPHPPSTGGGGSATSIFDMAIGHFVINRGELDYNDRRIPLEGEVHDLQAKVDFEILKTQYDGELAYREGRLQIADFNPIAHGIDVKFEATPSALKINSLDLNSGSSTASLQGQVQNYANPSIDGTYQGNIYTQELGKILKVASIPVGQVNLNGTLHYQSRQNRAVLENLATDGIFRSATLAFSIPQAHANIRGVAGKFNMQDGTLEVKNVTGALLGGNASGKLTITHLADRPVAKFAAELRGISLGATSAALNSQAMQRATIAGNLNGKIDGSWEGAGEKFRIRADATIAGATGSSPGAMQQAGAVPLQGDLHLTYDNPSETLTVRASKLQAPHTSITLDGTAGKQSSLALQLQSDDLREVDVLALIARRAFSSDSSSNPAPIEPFGLGGSGSFIGQLRGSTNDVQLMGEVTSNHFQYHDATLNLLQANLVVGASQLSLSHGTLRPVEGGQIDFSGSAVLTDWAYKPQNSVQVDLNASGVPVSTIQQAAKLHYPISGTLTAHASLQGSQSDMKGQGTVGLTQGVAWEQPFQNLDAKFQVAGVTLHSTLQLTTPAGAGSGDIRYDFPTQSYDAKLNLPNFQIENLEGIQKRELPISGVLNATIQGKGTLKQPQFAAFISAPNLTVGRQSLNGFQLRTAVVNQQANFVVESTASGASIQGNGTVGLNGDYPIEASLDMKSISLGALLADFAPQVPSDVAGQAELHATLKGPLRNRNLLEGEINVPKLSLNYRTLQIGNVKPIHAVFRGGVISLEQCELKGTGTDLQLRGALPLGRDQNLQALANGDVDLHLIQLFSPRWNGSGQIHLDMNAAGTRAHPDVNGTIRFNKAAFEAPDSPIGAENVNGVIALKNGRMEIQSFKGEAGGGTFTAQGFAAYSPAAQYNISLTARKVRLRYPLGTRTILDGNLMLTGTKDSGVLSGQLSIDRLSLTKDFDLATFADQFGTISTPSSGPSLTRNIKVSVSLKSAREMALASSKLSVQGSVDLMVRGTVAEPVLLGRTDITGGEIFFGGNRYTVESGVVQFVNPIHTEPVVNILVTTTVNQFNLSMNFMGPLDRLRTTYTSDPPLAPVDIINLITTGRTTEAASGSQTSPESVLAGQLTGQFSSRVEKLAGVSSLTIDPQVGGGQGNSGILAVQQRVTKNLYFTFSTNLRTSTGQTVQVEYQVSKRFALSTTRDQNGVYTVQVKVHKRF